MNDNKKDDLFEIIEILENTIIIYKDGDRVIYEAVFLNREREIIFGKLLRDDELDLDNSIELSDCNEIFIEYGGIPKDNIKSIEGGIKKTVFKKN